VTHPQNFATADPALGNVLSRLLDAGQLAWLTPHLDEMGALAATDIDAAAWPPCPTVLGSSAAPRAPPTWPSTR
jgi:hypothetical protein